VFEKSQARATSYLAGMAITRASELVGIDADMGVAVGLVPQTICSVACKEQADLIVLSTTGETGLKRWMFGSVAQETVHRSSVPVLLLNAQSVVPRMPHSAYPLEALVILDGSPLAESIVEPTAQLLAAIAAPAQGILRLVRVVDHPLASGKWRSQAHSDSVWIEQARQGAEMEIARVVDRLYKGPLASLELIITTSVVNSTDMAKTIINVAEDTAKSEYAGASSLLALATRGWRGLGNRVEGSVTKHILGFTRASLLIVHPHEPPAYPGTK
jgi:nucleotide-binding universal stress UspA family protein